ncbi:hydratase [Rhodobacterales bacterium LSUCC0246]|nr:hydratase [Rhodobacterales bacterium LSUCC0374]
METDAIRRASQLLVSTWQSGSTISALPSHLKPSTRVDGYSIQEILERESQAALFGWKIAATSSAGQNHIGVNGPMAGRLIESMVSCDGDVLPLVGNNMRVAEPEFAFKLGHSLPPRTSAYSLEEVMSSVSELFLALEMPASRFTDFARAGEEQLIADNACGHQFVLGPNAPDLWRGLDLSEHHVIGRVGDHIVRDGIGKNVLGDPRLALTWIANELSKIGVGLQSGQIVTTGTCMLPLEISHGDTVFADFGVLGQISCSFE